MQALQQKCRPKHQVLVLKCYPRISKGAVDVKPNSSELSYLLFYATSRKTKIQKVGSFLEKKTASDVWHQRIGNVQVTLQILEAMIEKSPKDIPLFAPSVLKILDLILRSNDITLVQSSIPTFDAYCQNHDASALFADQLYLRQYEAVVKQYAALASTRETQGKTKPSSSVALRWRNVGLAAIQSIASSDAMSSVAGRQINVVVPMILENLWTDNEGFLDVLLRRANMEVKTSADHGLRRRGSSVSGAQPDMEEEPNPIALSGSAGDVEKMEEEQTGVLAIQCLKQIFVVPTRSQLSAATAALLKFIEERISQDETVVKTGHGSDRGWAIKILWLMAQWTPMQERYVILVTAMDTMQRTPLKHDTLRLHLALTAMIGSLLRSDVNLIGLSVIDVLLGLIQHMKRLVQMPGDPTGGTAKQVATPGAQRKELLGRIQQTMADLATHVYYNEQIIDMVSALLLHLKPARSSGTAASTPQAETDADTKSDEQHMESLFSLTVAKITALKAIKLILKVANPKVKITANISLSRYLVPIEKWEGTEWLLRDSDGEVRKAYVDALLTWLDRETNPGDLVAREDIPFGAKRNSSSQINTKRARSAASYRERPSRKPKSLFVHQLHIAIYDSALQYYDYDSDVVLLHALLTKLVMRLGVNAVRFGLAMVFRLQEDIQEAETPQQKVRLGSLCHGYFWVLAEKFDFETTAVGRAIQHEIVRRRTKHMWVEGVSVPAPPLDNIGTPGMVAKKHKLSQEEAEYEALLPFDDRLSLVDFIVSAYENGALSPTSSPPGSPGRQFTQPMLGGNINASPPGASSSRDLPSSFKEAMLYEWSRDSALASLQAASKSASLSGSRNGTTVTRGRLGFHGAVTTSNHKADSPFQSTADLRPRSQPAQDGRRLAPWNAMVRKTSVRSAMTGKRDSAAAGPEFVTPIRHMRMVLSGDMEAPPLTARVRDLSSSDESMVSYDPSNSDVSFSPPAPTTAHSASPPGTVQSRSLSHERGGSDGASLGPLNSNPPSEYAPDDEEYVPPVPPLPSSLVGSSPPPAQTAARDYATSPFKQRGIKSRGRSSTWSSVQTADEPLPTMDLQSLLKGIDPRAGEGSLGNLTRPPY